MANGVAAFDTFSIGENLGKVFDKSQTKAIIEALSASRSETVSKTELEAKMTKVEANVEKHESKVLQAIAAMEARFDAKNEIMKRDIIIRITAVVTTVVIGTAGLMLAAIKLLFH